MEAADDGPPLFRTIPLLFPTESIDGEFRHRQRETAPGRGGISVRRNEAEGDSESGFVDGLCENSRVGRSSAGRTRAKMPIERLRPRTLP
jgi:hypothetical protein